jgi:hypothetical protein
MEARFERELDVQDAANHQGALDVAKRLVRPRDLSSMMLLLILGGCLFETETLPCCTPQGLEGERQDASLHWGVD